jgi:hypothetical protein
MSQLTLYNAASPVRDRPQSRGLDKVGAVRNRPAAARSAPRSDPPAPTTAVSSFFILPSSFCLLPFPYPPPGTAATAASVKTMV